MGILAINSQLNKNPQFVCVDERNQKHFVIVKAILYPENPIDYDMIFMQTLKEHALKFNARIYYAGVGLANAKDYELPLTTSSDYIVNFNGLLNCNQTIMKKLLWLYLLDLYLVHVIVNPI